MQTAEAPRALHPSAQALLDLLRHHRAMSMMQLARAAGMTRGAVYHHVRTLEREGLVYSGRSPAQSDLVLRVTGCSMPLAEALLRLSNPSWRSVALAVRRTHGASTALLARDVGLGLKRTQQIVREGMLRGLWDMDRLPTPLLQQALETLDRAETGR